MPSFTFLFVPHRFFPHTFVLLMLFQLTACADSFDDYCSNRASAECRQIFKGGCFEPVEQRAYGSSREKCEETLENDCLKLSDDVAEGKIPFFSHSAKQCTDIIKAMNCNDYKAKDPIMQVCDSAVGVKDDDIFSF